MITEKTCRTCQAFDICKEARKICDTVEHSEVDNDNNEHKGKSLYEIAEQNGYRDLTATERFKAIARETCQTFDFLAFITISDFELTRKRFPDDEYHDDEWIALKTAQYLESLIWHTARDICLKLRILLKDHNWKAERRDRI
jgi:hypothetical protein